MKATTLALIALTLAAVSVVADMAEAQTLPGYSVPTYSCVRNWYVSPTGSDSNAGNSPSSPWLTLQRADANVQAGDCVNLASGTYYLSSAVGLSHGGNANTSTGYVVYRSTVAQGAHLIMSGTTPTAVSLINLSNTNYLVFDGLNLDGNNSNVGGACIGSNGGHHIVVENSLVHGCGEAGLGFGSGEYYWFVNNTVYNNAVTFNASGIDIYEPALASVFDPSFQANANDQALYYHIVVANNISHDNVVGASVPAWHTDGNGIIFDDFDHSQHPGAPYTQPSLIEGNMLYNNGTSGILLYFTQGVTVANNSAYNNYIDQLSNEEYWRDNILCMICNNSTFINNAAYAVIGGGYTAYNEAYGNLPDTTRGPVNVTWTTNIGYPLNNGTITGSGNLFDINPQFNNPSAGNFGLQAGSRAIGAATPEPWLSSGTNDMGAWQPTSTSPANPTYYTGNIVNSQSGRCLDADTGTIGSNGTKMQLWACWGGQNQSWTVNSNGAIVNAQSGQCLDADTGTIGSNGTKIQLWSCTGGQNQSWTRNSNGTIVNNESGRCLDADTGTIAGNGTIVQLWDCWGGQNQVWLQ